MERLLNFLKKFFKWTIFLAVALLGILFLIAKYNDHKSLIANSIDEEIGLMCKTDISEDSRFIRVILQATPNSKKTNNYWKKIQLVTSRDSELSDKKQTRKLRDFSVEARTLDYVIARDADLEIKINRENYNLAIKTTEYSDIEEVDFKSLPCEVVNADEIRAYVKKANDDASSRNIL